MKNLHNQIFCYDKYIFNNFRIIGDRIFVDKCVYGKEHFLSGENHAIVVKTLIINNTFKTFKQLKKYIIEREQKLERK